MTRLAMETRQALFERIWSENMWGSAESRSGAGSELARTRDFRAGLERFLARVGARSLYDAPCGDFNWMRSVSLPSGCEYQGADIVPPLVQSLQREYGREGRRFDVRDIVEVPPPDADIWLCRESLFHLSFEDASRVIDHWRASKVRYFLATTTPTLRVNRDIDTGGWRRVNLAIEPFNLGPPDEQLPDAAPKDPDKVVGVWTHPTVDVVRSPAR